MEGSQERWCVLVDTLEIPYSLGLQPTRKLLPYVAFTSFKASYEEPGEAEGFHEVKFINWKFEGSESEKRFWNMWLQIDGK